MPFTTLTPAASSNGAHTRPPRVLWNARAAHPRPRPPADASNPNRSPKRDAPDDYVKVESGGQVCSSKMIGVLSQDPVSHVVRINPYPYTKEMEIDVPPEAAAAVANETKTPFGFIRLENQLQFVPLVQSAIALPLTDEENEANAERRAEVVAAHEKAMADLKRNPYSSCHHDELSRCAKALAEVGERQTQKPITPSKIEVRVDPGLGILEVSVGFKNTFGQCGEVAVNLAATEGLTYLSVFTKIADYPYEIECMSKKEALKSYKAINKSVDKGAALSENGRLTHGTRFKMTDGDESITTFRLKVSNLEQHWKPLPMAESGTERAVPEEVMEYAIFSPPGDGKATIPFCVNMLAPDDDSIAYDLAPSAAAIHEATLRKEAIFYVPTTPRKGGWSWDAGMQPMCIKARLKRTNEWDTLGDFGLDRLAIQTKPSAKVLAHARCGHAKMPGTDEHDCLALVELYMPFALENPTRVVPTRLDVCFVLDASGSMFTIAPSNSGMSNLQKLGKHFGTMGRKMLGLVPYLRKNGLSIPGDQIVVHCIRFHSGARYIASEVDLTSPNAEAAVETMIKSFQDSTDSGGTSYCAWLDHVEKLAAKDTPLVILLGTDGGAHDGHSFFPRLERLKESKSKLAISVVAMGAWLDEACAARTQTNGHRLMQEVGAGFVDQGYQLLFASIVKLMQGLSITIDGTVLAVTGEGEMPAIDGASRKTMHNMRLGTKVQYTLCGKYAQDGTSSIVMPAFKLGDGTPIEMRNGIGHLTESADAVLAAVDATYCAPTLCILADAKEAHERAVTGLAYHYQRDTMYTACRTVYDYGGDRAKLPADVKATLPPDVVSQGLLWDHRSANPAWMRMPGNQGQRAHFVEVHYEPPPCYRGLGEEPMFTSLGCDDEGSAPGFRSLGAAGGDEEPVLRSAFSEPEPEAKSTPPPKASAKMDVKLDAVPGANLYLGVRNQSYDREIRDETALTKVLQELVGHETWLRTKTPGTPASVIAPGAMLTDEMLARMADEQGAEHDDHLPEIVADLPSIVGVLVHLAFLTRFEGGIHILNDPIGEPTNAQQVLMRVKYLREIAQRMAGVEVAWKPLYRPVFSFHGFGDADADSKDITTFKASIKFELTPVKMPAQPQLGIGADTVVGTAEEAVRDVCKIFAKGLSEHTELNTAHVPAPSLVFSNAPINGFDQETIRIPAYQLAGPPPARYSGLGCDPMEDAEPVPAAVKLDAAYFDKLTAMVTKQVVDLCIKKNA